MWTQPPGAPGRPFDFTVSCPVEQAPLALIRHFILSVARQAGFAEDDALKIEMAVDEACANVIQHAYPAGSVPAGPGLSPVSNPELDADAPPRLELGLKLDGEGLTIHIRDHGRGGRPESLRGADSIEDYQRPGRFAYHGLGLLIIRQFMDEVCLQAQPGDGVALTMRKLRHPSSSEASAR